MKEIVDAVLFQIQESGYADRLRNGVVLTGGCANLANCANLIKLMSGYNVRIGFPKAKSLSYSGCPGIADTGAVATVGMLLYVREDTHLNCTEEVPFVKTQGKPATQPVEEPVEQTTTGSVFDTEGWEVKKEEKPKKEPKPKKSNFLINWTKKLAPVEDFVGGLYDKIEEN